MDRDAKMALERAGLQLLDAGEALKEIAAIVAGIYPPDGDGDGYDYRDGSNQREGDNDGKEK